MRKESVAKKGKAYEEGENTSKLQRKFLYYCRFVFGSMNTRGNIYE